ncbi:hypothetical protein SCOR_31690 [Sulfidibacter corallicola]|uniref:Uncharacterized protein n=1 Tax=Sulfidibacter corallicola TaxID=2818388 RepID=A0A8A4TLX9_SULCO|nr:hypothetical protein [Sulfidibacter corallicola]QTD49888.1 hypothetical protein J3U87_30265 [Sulfidibacter corallicola]
MTLILFTILCGWPFDSWPLKAPEADQPTFFIEQIEIQSRGRVPEGVILAESLLREGQAYTESQLKSAGQRINRLPFVLESRFQLERGSKRGTYRLVIHLQETRSLFLQARTEFRHFQGEAPDQTYDITTLGGRWFFGAHNLLYATVSPDWRWSDASRSRQESYALGYSHYNLFRRHVFFDFQLLYFDDHAVEVLNFNLFSGFRISPVLTVSAPLKGNHFLKVRASLTDSDQDASDTLFQTVESQQRSFPNGDQETLSLAWHYDTTDDNFAPTQGESFFLDVRRNRIESFSFKLETTDFFQERELLWTSDERIEYKVWSRYQKQIPWRQRHVLRWAGEFRWSRSEYDRLLRTQLFEENRLVDEIEESESANEVLSGLTAEFGYSYDLWGNQRTRKYGDLRFDALFSAESVHSDFDVGETSYRSYRLDTQVQFRNSWGVFGLGVYYTWDD